MPTPTPQQQAIIAAAAHQQQHIIVQARAGTGKTTTLLQLLSRLRGNVSLQAFNKAIAKEIDQRIDALPMAERLSLPAQIDVSTCHAAGLRAYNRNRSGKKPQVQGGKLAFIQKQLWKTNTRDGEYFHKAGSILTRVVSAAKSAGFDLSSTAESFPSSTDDTAWYDLLDHFNWDVELEQLSISLPRAIAHCQQVFRISNQQHDIIDFDDMIYLPLLLNHQLTQYSHVLIDEAQDISATRREMAFRMLAPTGRIIAVGDEYQAIYGFTGADADSLRNIQRRAKKLGDVTALPLTTCWRCDAEIIATAKRFVPDIEARPSANGGTVTSISMTKIIEQLAGSSAEPSELIPSPGDAILCRLNKPNVAMALELIRSGRRARIEGRDIGQKLLTHARNAAPGYAFMGLAALIVELEDYGQRQAAILAQRERQMQAELLLDEISCAVLLAERCLEQGLDDYDDLSNMVSDMFGDDVSASDIITLSSVHKSKGREWRRVFILGRYDYMPFHLATADWEEQQERNLIYVATTRAEKFLCHITDVKQWLDGRRDS